MELGFTTGDQDVLQAFFDKDRRLGVVCCAGGVRNSFLAGAHIYLRQIRKRLRSSVATIGVSSGFATSAYYLGGGKSTDVRVFSDDMTDKRMFDLRRRFIGRHPFDVDYVDRVFRHGETGRAINADAVMRHDTRLYGVLADPLTGEGWTELPANAHEVWELASIATAVTGFARPTMFRGRLVTDGYASSLQLPVRELLRLERHVTDVLVFAAQHYEEKPKLAPWSEMLLYKTRIAHASKPMQELIKTRHQRFMAEANRVINPDEVGGVRVCIVWLPQAYHPIFVSQDQSRNLIRSGYWTMRTLLQSGLV
ncbi:hypothetical protein K2P47_00815 [Patescibacteria group bacterium]|nr:hypothetical protein [Patescibacteria group bacterium]